MFSMRPVERSSITTTECALLDQKLAEVRADESGAPGHQVLQPLILHHVALELLAVVPAQASASNDPSARRQSAAAYPMCSAWCVLSCANRPRRPNVSDPRNAGEPAVEGREARLRVEVVDRIGVLEPLDDDLRPGASAAARPAAARPAATRAPSSSSAIVQTSSSCEHGISAQSTVRSGGVAAQPSSSSARTAA